MTKFKVLQIGAIIALVGFLSYEIFPLLGFNEITTSSISNFILISIVFIWVLTYLLRVVNGDMTFIEQRKRYRKEYEKAIDKKLQNKFDKLSVSDQEKLLKELEEK